MLIRLRQRTAKVGALFAAAMMIGPFHFAAAAEGENSLDFKYMYYWDRNDVWNHTPSFSFFKRFASHLSARWNQELDAVSGASRRLGLKNIGGLSDNNLLLDGVSGASRREIRHSEKLEIGYDKEGRSAAGSFYYSDEPDYTSLSPAFSGAWDFNQRNTTVGLELSHFWDDFHPQGGFKGLGGNRQITSVTTSMTQLVSPLSLAAITVNVTRSSGYLGHPYTPVILSDGAMVLEDLPNNKLSTALSGQWIQGYRVLEKLGSLRFEARHYRDNWGLNSNTGEVQAYQYFTENSALRLRARVYDQGAALFAKDAYVGNEVYRTADIRFYAFRSLTLGAKVLSRFPESWGESGWLPDRWDISYDYGWRNTRGERDGVGPPRRYQLFSPDLFYTQGTVMAGLGFDL